MPGRIHNGLDPDNAVDNNEDADGDGYLNPEEFLNETDPTGGQSSGVPSQGPGCTEAEAMVLSNYDTVAWKSASEGSIIYTDANESSVVGPSNAAVSRLILPHIYANPASNQLIVEGRHDYRISLYDLAGRPVMQRDHLSGKITLDISHLRSGVYSIKIQDAQGQLNRQRMVVE